MADNTKFAPQQPVMAVAQPVVAQAMPQAVVQQGVAVQQPVMAQGMVVQPVQAANHVVYVQGGVGTYAGQDPEQCAKIMFIIGCFFGLVAW